MAHAFDSPFVALRSQESEREELLAAIEREADEALALARWLSEHRERSPAEHRTSARYIAYLGAHGFRVETPVAGVESAFVARHGSGIAPARIALLAEMNAPPDVGHPRDHELSGPASLLAAAALAEVLPEGDAHLVVVGTRAEEAGVGRAALVDAGIFDEVDCALIAPAPDGSRAARVVPTLHPGDRPLDGRAFADAIGATAGEDGVLERARTLALTVLALARRPEAREALARAWEGAER